MEARNRELLVEAVAGLGVRLEEGSVELCARYLELLGRGSERMNLTAVRGERAQVIRHLVDSLAVVPRLEEELGRLGRLRVMDLGSGAGLPGIPVKVALPAVEMVLCESRQKRAGFLEMVVRELGLEGVRVYAGRAEEYPVEEDGGFDVVVVRGVGEIGKVVPVCAGLVRGLGRVLLFKGPDPAGELARAAKKVERAGFRLAWIVSYELPEGAGRRSIVELEKTST